jgi:hypothetical protein
VGKLISPVQTQEEFENLMTKLVDKHFNNEDYSGGERMSTEEKVSYIIYKLVDGKLEEDLKKVDFDFENTDTSDDDGVGFQSIDNFYYFGVTAGGDWEFPVYFILYFDENFDLRAYIPEKGNCYNIKLQSAFGNNVEREEEQYNQGYSNQPTTVRIQYNDTDAVKEQYGFELDDDEEFMNDYDTNFRIQRNCNFKLISP